jgi:subtilase family serine protease
LSGPGPRQSNLQPYQIDIVFVGQATSDQKAFDNAVKDLYTPGSPTYHRWMTSNQIAGYAPTANEVQSVISALESNGLAVLSAAPDNLSIRVRGPAADSSGLQPTTASVIPPPSR